jgi:septal ring factor EnvC (AmiA/AmiB activator)
MELEGARKTQEEAAALRKELSETHQALANKEADVAQLEDSNGRLNDEMALLAYERRWFLTMVFRW